MTTRYQILAALRATVAAACPGVVVRGFTEDAAKPERVASAGMIVGDPGDPGDPEYDLSPISYTYTHRIPVEILMPVTPGSPLAADQAIDALLIAIGAAIAANRRLSGLCNFLDATAPTVVSDDLTGAVALRVASFDLVAEYTVFNPIGG